MKNALSSESINAVFGITDKDIRTYSPQTLAFIGDVVFDLIIRTMLVNEGNRGVNGLHKDKSALVNANTQAFMAEHFSEILSEEEMDIYRRGKNTKTASHAKNAGLSAYQKATGFEALLGYLYLTGQNERLFEVVKLSLSKLEKQETDHNTPAQ